MIPIYFKYVVRQKVFLKYYNLGSLSRELMSIVRLYVDHKTQ